MTIIRSATACVSLLALAGCVAVPPPGPSYAPAYSAPAPVYSTAPVYAVPAPAPTVIYTQPAYVAPPPRYRNGPPPRLATPPLSMKPRPRSFSWLEKVAMALPWARKRPPW